MLKARMEYGAVYAKVMAMYGKLLKQSEWQRLCECKNLTELCAQLRNYRAWSETMASLPPSVSAKVLQTAVSKRVYIEHEKLYKFLHIEDKKFLRFSLCRAEYDLILDTLRGKSPFELFPKSLELTDFIRANSTIDLDALEQSKSLSAVQNAVRGSIFEKPLSELKVNPETGKPNYWEVGVALENAYYREMFSYISHKYKGLGRKKLEESVGLEADLLNIVSVIRLLKSFPSSLERADELLIPITARLKPELLSALKSAKGENEAFELLRRSPFGKYFEGIAPSNIESFYYTSMEKFCRKLVKAAEPDIGVPLAYLTLKELECRKLNRVIEAVSLGVDPKSVI